MKKLKTHVAAIIAAMVVVGQSCAQMTRLEETALPHDVYYFRVPAGDPVRFVPLQPLDLRTTDFALADGGYVCGFPTGPAGGIIYVDAYQNGPPGEIPVWKRLKLTIAGTAPDEPDVPDDPDPQPLGTWARLARDAVNTIPERSRVLVPAIAANFQATASAVAAGVITSKQAALQDLQRRNQAAWGTNGEADWRDWLYKIGREVDRVEDAGKLENVKTYGLVLKELGKGLAAYGS